MLLASRPRTHIRAAINILILSLTLKFVPCKFSLIHSPIRLPHDALPRPLAVSIIAGVTSSLSYKVQANPLPSVVAVLPKVSIAIGVYGFCTVVLSLVCAVIAACRNMQPDVLPP